MTPLWYEARGCAAPQIDPTVPRLIPQVRRFRVRPSPPAPTAERNSRAPPPNTRPSPQRQPEREIPTPTHWRSPVDPQRVLPHLLPRIGEELKPLKPPRQRNPLPRCLEKLLS